MSDVETIFQGLKAYWARTGEFPQVLSPAEDPNVAMLLKSSGDMLLGYPADELKKATVLELSCRSGELLPFIAPAVKRYVGWGLTTAGLKAAEKEARGLSNVTLIEANSARLGEWPFKDLDLVVSRTFFQHLPYSLFLHFLHTLGWGLRSGVRVHIQLDWPLLTEAHKREERWRFDRLADDDFRARWYPEWLVWHLLEDAGFEILEMPWECSECWRMVKR